jgi:hypothetical protein
MRSFAAFALAFLFSIPAFAEEPTLDDAESRTRGLRLHVGAFALAHAKRGDGASFSMAPGVSIGGAYRIGRWELEAGARGATLEQSFDHRDTTAQVPDNMDLTGRTRDDRLTQFLAGGIGGRWFSSRSASTAAFLGGGVEYMLFYWERSGCCADSIDGRAGFALRAGAGVEILHDAAHGRLAFEANATFPTFRFRASGKDDLYVVPLTFGARLAI